MAIVLVGTFDTKGSEFAFVRDLLAACGLETLTIDAGSQGPPTIAADIARDRLFGKIIPRDRGQAVAAAALGVTRIVLELHAAKKVDGILGLGGSAGTIIATAAMRALPFGVPKVMVSTLASGQVRPFVGVRDIAMFHSVVDLAGINRVSRTVLAHAAHALAGMVQHPVPPAPTDRPLIAASMFGVTTPCVQSAQKIVDAAGYEVLVFHATGTGGLTLESFVTDGLVAGVLDITTTELADELVGGILSAGRDRLTAAAIRGIPQVISLGALDMVNFGPRETVPERFANRRFHVHNANVTLMRTTPEENDRLGKEIAEKASAARGPTAILVPLRGVSALDCDGGPFWWPEADAALFASLRNWISPSVKVIEVDRHINDPEFAKLAARTLLELEQKN